jgi:hypothetical protein
MQWGGSIWLTCSSCEILGPNSVNHHLNLVSFVEISKTKTVKANGEVKSHVQLHVEFEYY